MEGQNFAVNGGVKMPIGYRFHPTDEELVVHYLKRKALNLPLPASVIPELDVLQTDPWSLPGDVKENKYFFSKRHGNDGNNKRKSCGYWKAIGKEKPILASGTNRVIGMRQALVFCERKRSNETNTRWLLHRFRLVGSAQSLYPKQMFSRERLGEWLVFKAIQRKRKGKKHGSGRNQTSCIDFTVEDSSVFGSPPQPSSPSSCETTEVCPNGLLDEEISSFSESSEKKYSFTV
ncbi:NAC domain-containing protein 83-like [Hibiscus syriacus]|uniref:NAC domain-containing protein 83-like n=1 Tax=Hibiscus syriacus TaxID=106335 RepID=UPI0019243AE1|nr:NAC domain-containing protein 83-like [Hibiscus syriacus]